MVDRLTEMWDAQAASQRDMGLDPETMADRAREDELKNMLLGLQEQVSQLSLCAVNYKRHALRSSRAEPENVAERAVDVVKYAMAIAQAHGVSLDEFHGSFMDKTEVILSRARAERVKLTRRMKVLCVDIDHVLADASPPKLDGVNGGDPRRHLALLESYKDEYHASGAFRNLPLIPGARDALVAFQDHGWTIVLVTARPQWQYKRIYADTLYWLRDNDIPYHLLLFNKDKVEAIHADLAPAWPVAFVEDHPRNALALASAGVNVLLYDQPHNDDVPATDRIKRVKSWKDVTDALL